MSQKARQLTVTGHGQQGRKPWRAYQTRPFRNGYLTIQRDLDAKKFSILILPEWLPTPLANQIDKAISNLKSWKSVEKTLSTILHVPVLEAWDLKAEKPLTMDATEGSLDW